MCRFTKELTLFTADIVLDDVSGDDATYRLISQDSQGSRRIDIATTLVSPATLVIKHTSSGSGPNAVDRHLVQFNRTLEDAQGKLVTLTTNFTLAVPRNAVMTAATIADEVCHLIDFLSSGGVSTLASTANIESLVRGES
jgi:hypothetical protein